MPLAAIPFFGRFAACLAIVALLLAPAAALAEEDLTTDYKEFPRLEGGWDIYYGYEGGELVSYGGAFVFSGLGRFTQLYQDKQSPTKVAGTFQIVNSAPGRAQWEIKNKDGSQEVTVSGLFLSADVAISEWDLSGGEAPRFFMIRTACDFRFSDMPTPEIDGCKWMPLNGVWLEEAHLNGDCSLTLRCYRLVSATFNSYFD